MSRQTLSLPAFLVGLSLLARTTAAQYAAAPELAATTPVLSVFLEGVVIGPDGAPADGVRVVSSAGSIATTGPDGRYRFALEVPPEAEKVELTAVATGSRARTVVELSKASALTRVPPLALAASSGCEPAWLPTFGAEPTVEGYVSALAEFDDGRGPALYVAGGFELAGNVPAVCVVRWDGEDWETLGTGVSHPVTALAVFDDGSGPALYAGGFFTTAGGVAANGIARWDGASWAPLGEGIVPGWLLPPVGALAVFDDGSGPALYVGGHFTTAGGAPAGRIAKWDGTSWSTLGSGLGGDETTDVRTLAVFDDGSGPALYAGGNFTTAGGVAASHVAKWDGASWSAVGGGADQPVSALAVFDDGGGPGLFAGGAFALAGGVVASRVAKWDGASWSPLAGGANQMVRTLAVFDAGGGPALYAGGNFTAVDDVEASHVARWDGASWSALEGWAGGGVSALAPSVAGGGQRLFVGGNGNTFAEPIAAWDGAEWSQLGRAPNDTVEALATFDDGGGPALFAGGRFTAAGGETMRRIAKWDGVDWTPLGSGIAGMDSSVHALAVHDDGAGPALYAGGRFTAAGGVAAGKVARWDGAGWSALGSGIPGTGFVGALASFDAGGGAALYVGGEFLRAGGVTVNNVARWDGAAWSALGGGTNGTVKALAAFDAGGGPALFAAGDFTTAGGSAASHVARWDGAAWSALAGGVDGSVYAMAVFDDGSGPALYVAGDFASAGGVTAHDIARWDGTAWSALGGASTRDIVALATFDDGSGPALYVGGRFTLVGGLLADRVARWDGTSWSTLGLAMNSFDDPVRSAFVRVLAPHDDGTGPALFAGGEFYAAPDSRDSHLAKWGCPDTTPPVLVAPDHVLAGERIGSAPGEVVHFTVRASDDRDPEPSVVCVPPSGSVLPRGRTIVTCTATDRAGNQTTTRFPVTVARGIR